MENVFSKYDSFIEDSAFVPLLTRCLSYKLLQKRRNHEIEGFTNDIILLRKQLKTLEKTILKFAPIEDRECVLLSMAKATGDKVSKMSSDLQGMKVCALSEAD